MRAPDCLDSPVYEPDEEHATAPVLNAKERMDPAWRMQTASALTSGLCPSSAQRERNLLMSESREIAQLRVDLGRPIRKAR